MPEARLQRTREAYREPDAFVACVTKLRAEALKFHPDAFSLVWELNPPRQQPLGCIIKEP